MILEGKTFFITGSSRGIGRAIALRLAREGANIIIAAKTEEVHATLPGTIYTVADEVEKAGGRALPLKLDIRNEDDIEVAVKKSVEHFGGLDGLINNASAISLTPTLETPMKRFDLMFGVNVRGTYACAKACLPHLFQAKNPHILTLSPPLSLQAKWFKPHLAYTMSKYGMSLCTLGMAEEFREQGVAVNSLWPKTTIATSAIAVFFPPEILAASRKPEIVSDAAFFILTSESKKTTGNFFIDEEVLSSHGVTDFASYAITPGVVPQKDLFLD